MCKKYLGMQMWPYEWGLKQESQRLRPLGHEGLMVISGLMSYIIMGYKLLQQLRDNMCQIDDGCMFILTECQTKLSFLISM